MNPQSSQGLGKCLDQFFEHLQVIKNASPHTMRNYAIDLKSFQAHLEAEKYNITLESVDRKAIRSYLAKLIGQGLNKRSSARKLSALRSFFKFAHSRKLIAFNPTEELDSPKLVKKIPQPLAYEQVRELFAQPNIHTLLGLRDRTIMELLYSSGLRVSELISLDRGNFYPESFMLKLKGKGRKERMVPITKNAAAWLIRYLEIPERYLSINGHDAQADTTAIFLNRQGTRLSARSVDRRFKEYFNASGLAGKATPHTIRHTIATHWLENGMDLKTIQTILGHSALETTTIYTQVSPKLKKRVYDKAHPRTKNRPKNSILLDNSKLCYPMPKT